MEAITRTAAAGLIAGALLLAGCGSSDDASSSSTTKVDKTTTTVAAELELTDVWARQSPMGTSAGAIYLTITSPIDDSLVGASVPTSIAGTTEIHETVVAEDGEMSSTTEAMGSDTEMMTTTTMMGDTTETTMAEGSDSMTMQPVDAIELPAGEAVELKPGGYHIMLLELVKPLEVGESIELTLTFEKAGEKTVTAKVREG